MRFHVLGIPHTITTPEYVTCAFTMKVLKLCAMLHARGHYVFHYGHEASEVRCSEHVTVTTAADLALAYNGHDWRQSGWPQFSTDDPAYAAFNREAIPAIAERKEHGDFLLCPFGSGHRAVADAHADMIVVESGIGYARDHFAPYKVFESYAIMHAALGLEPIATAGLLKWYDAVIPNAVDPDDFEYRTEKSDYFLFLGRLTEGKGIHLAAQLAAVTGYRVVAAGHGDLKPLGIEYVGIAAPAMRRELLAGARATLCLSTFVEPFCGVQIESMMSGTPVISTDWGAFAEYNPQALTGMRCRTFEQFIWAMHNIGRIDPRECRTWAERFNPERIAAEYDEYFTAVSHIYGRGGWYEPNPARKYLVWPGAML